MRGLPSLRTLDEDAAGVPRVRLWLASEATDMRCGFDRLEELDLLLERVDYSSGRLEDIGAMKFWNHLEASSEFLEALGYEWTNQLGFDCHASFTLAWFVPEGMVGYLAGLGRFSRSMAWLPEEL